MKVFEEELSDTSLFRLFVVLSKWLQTSHIYCDNNNFSVLNSITIINFETFSTWYYFCITCAWFAEPYFVDIKFKLEECVSFKNILSYTNKRETLLNISSSEC